MLRELLPKALMYGFGITTAVIAVYWLIVYLIHRIAAWIHHLRHPWE